MIRGYLRTLKSNVTLHPMGITCDRSITDKIRGYLRTLKNYLRTTKAQHDLKDYARALAMIIITTAIITFIIRRCAL